MNNLFFIDEFLQKEIIIFGTGTYSCKITERLGHPISFFVDNDSSKWGKVFLEKNIYSPQHLLSISKDKIIILIASSFYSEIGTQLSQMGFKEHIHYFTAENLIINPLNFKKNEIAIKESFLIVNKITLYIKCKFDSELLIQQYKELNPFDERNQLFNAITELKDSTQQLSLLEAMKNVMPNYRQQQKMLLASEYEEREEKKDPLLSTYTSLLATAHNPATENQLVEKIILLNKRNIHPPFVRNKQKTTTYLHLVIDNFYTNSFISFIREHFPNQKHTFLLIKSPFGKIKYISEENIKALLILNETGDYHQNAAFIFPYIQTAKKLYIHYATNFINWLLCCYDFKIEVNWISWGGDLYHYLEHDLYDHETKQLSLTLLEESFLEKKKLIALKIGAVKKTDYILCGNEGEFELSKKNFSSDVRMKFFVYPNPINIEKLNEIKKNNIKHLLSKRNPGKKIILVGNSGDPSNNHISVLKHLSRFKNKDFIVVLPLAYGDPDYINIVSKMGSDLFRERFFALTEFINPEEYGHLLNSVDFVIMNHKRQQSLGNLLALLYLGKAVFINKDVTTYESLTSKGMTLFSIDHFLKAENFEELTDNESYLEKNESAVIKQYGHERIKEIYKDLFNE